MDSMFFNLALNLGTAHDRSTEKKPALLLRAGNKGPSYGNHLSGAFSSTPEVVTSVTLPAGKNITLNDGEIAYMFASSG